MTKALYMSLLTCLCLFGQGQVLNFNSMNAMHMNSYVRSGCVDNIGNIYIGGDFSKINGVDYWGIAKWNGIQWDSLSSGLHMVGQGSGSSNGARAMAYYNGNIYVGGNFTNVQGKPIRYLAKWNGTQWDSLPQSPNLPPARLIVCNGKLYALGGFGKIGNVTCNNMAVWDDVSWTPLSPPFGIYELADAVEYKGELYFGGNLFNGSLPGSLIKFDGTTWSVVGGGIKGSLAWVNALKVFNNELYIGGWIEKSAGNAGDFLIKWDGTSYKEVIRGLDGQVLNLTEVPDGLIATGCFANPFLSVLKISNNGVCGYSNAIFNNCIQGSIYGNNKLYFYGGFMTVNGDSTLGWVNNVNYTTQTDSCQAFVTGLNETALTNTIKVYPNPTNSILNITDEKNELQNSTIEISNSIGQNVLQIPFNSTLDVSKLPSGCYFISITTEQKKVLHTKFIRE